MYGFPVVSGLNFMVLLPLTAAYPGVFPHKLSVSGTPSAAEPLIKKPLVHKLTH